MDFENLQRKNEELAILNAIAQRLNREVSLSDALTTSLEQVVKLLNLKTGWIWLFHPDSDSAYVAAAYNLPSAFTKDPSLLSGWCYCIEKYLSDDLENTSNISEITCTRLKNLTEGTDGLRYHSSVLLYSQDRKLGILNVVSPHLQELSEETLNMLHTIGDMMSIAIERAQLFENSRQLGIIQERNRLAREIHDTLAQGLSAISLKLETLEALLDSGASPEKLKGLIDQSLGLTKASLEEARRSVMDLRATPLQDRTWIEAIRLLIERDPNAPGISAGMDIKGAPMPLSSRIEMGLYRIAQEAIGNAMKHANASTLYVQITFAPGKVALSIEDNGVGFNPESIAHNGFGLVGMNERAKLLHGNFLLTSSPGMGTRIEVVIPL